MVFNSRFGLDEFSKGADVLEMFTRLGERRNGSFEPRELAATFMRETLGGGNSLSALEAFAEMIRKGLSTEDALMKTKNCNSELFR